MNNPSYGIVKNLWCSLGKPFRSQLIKLNDGWNYHVKREQSPFFDMKKLLEKENPTIVDGGASNGSTIVKFKQQFPNSTILAFEPVTNTRLEENVSKYSNIHIFHNALGEKNDIAFFNETEFSDTSSILFPSDLDNEKHLKVKNSYIVRVVSLDDMVVKEHFVTIDIIKFDLQGYELNALKGSKDILKNQAKIVLVECSFKEFYVGQPLFCEIYQYMKSFGFDVWNIYRGNHEGPIGFMDVLFIKGE